MGARAFKNTPGGSTTYDYDLNGSLDSACVEQCSSVLGLELVTATKQLCLIFVFGVLTGCEPETFVATNVSSDHVVVECAGERLAIGPHDTRSVRVSLDENANAVVTVGERKIQVPCEVRKEDRYIEVVIQQDGSVVCGGS